LKGKELAFLAASRENKQGGFETRPYTRRMTVILCALCVSLRSLRWNCFCWDSLRLSPAYALTS